MTATQQTLFTLAGPGLPGYDINQVNAYVSSMNCTLAVVEAEGAVRACGLLESAQRTADTVIREAQQKAAEILAAAEAEHGAEVRALDAQRNSLRRQIEQMRDILSVMPTE